jgi:predicted nucleic acid-binding protein
MKLIDTNIWAHALSEHSEKREKALALTNALMGLGEAAISTQNVLELYSALTKTLPTDESAYWAEHFLDTKSIIKLEPSVQDTRDALELAKKNKMRRGEVFDALLVATAKRNGIDTILTENPRHFEKLGLKVETLETATLSEGF